MSAVPYDALLVDLDGTVYRGPDAIDGAVASLEAVRSGGTALSFVTNNAARGPEAVAGQLARLGLTVARDDVVTSAQAAAAMLADAWPAGTRVLVVGAEALADEIRAVGLTPVRTVAEDARAVVQGHSPDTCWADLAEAALTLRAGGAWVACNIDPTLPTERGLLPGNGSMVAALRAATGLEPDVAGKPATPLLRQAVARVGSEVPLVVGDRLDTDIAGGRAVGADTLLVLTGVSTPRALLAAPVDLRPTYVAADLRVLTAPPGLDAARVDRDARGEPTDRGWVAGREGETVLLRRDGDPSGDSDGAPCGDPSGDDAVAALRALCGAAWADPEATPVTAVRAGDGPAERVITALDLPTS